MLVRLLLMACSERVQALLGDLVEDVAERKEGDPHDDGEGGRLADVPELERHLVGEHARGLGRRARPAASQDEHGVEHLERVDQAQQPDHREKRGQHRQSQPKEDLQAVRAVDCGSAIGAERQRL